MSSIGKKGQARGQIYLGSILLPLKLMAIYRARDGGSCNGHTGEVREGNSSCR